MKTLSPAEDFPAVQRRSTDTALCLRRILVPTDFSALSRAALESCMALFKNDSAVTLTLAHVVECPPAPWAVNSGQSVDTTLENRVSAAAKELLRLKSNYGDEVKLETCVLAGSPAHALCELAEAEDFDLIALSSHGHTGLARTFIGSVAERVVQDARCPVLVVKLPKNELGQFLSDPVDLKLCRLLVGYDHRKGAELALQMAVWLAEKFGSEIALIHALEPGHFGLRWGDTIGSASEAACVSKALTELDKVRSRYLPNSSKWKSVVQIGHPWEVIPACAEKIGCDAIIVGPHDHTRWGHSFAGSTAQRIVRLAPCAVIAVK
jgi:nucleotide-binding universal stress UspA family protein